MNVVMTTYFYKKKNPMTNKYVESNDIKYIKPWYYSVKKLKLRGIIFHDGLSSKFITKYSTHLIKFIYVDTSEYSCSLNDLRFFVYYKYLANNKNIKNVFMTDGNDIKLVKSPFNNIDSEKVYIGSEVKIKIAFDSRYKDIHDFIPILKLWNQYMPKIGFKKGSSRYYNAGILGGSYHMVILMLKLMLKVFRKLKPELKSRNMNMAVLNYTVYNQLGENKVITEKPLHSRFMYYENHRKDIYFIHK